MIETHSRPQASREKQQTMGGNRVDFVASTMKGAEDVFARLAIVGLVDTDRSLTTSIV